MAYTSCSQPITQAHLIIYYLVEYTRWSCSQSIGFILGGGGVLSPRWDSFVPHPLANISLYFIRDCPLLKFAAMRLPPLERNPEINPGQYHNECRTSEHICMQTRVYMQHAHTVVHVAHVVPTPCTARHKVHVHYMLYCTS